MEKALIYQAADLLLTANEHINAAKRLFRKLLRGELLSTPDRVGTDPPAIAESHKESLLRHVSVHYSPGTCNWALRGTTSEGVNQA